MNYNKNRYSALFCVRLTLVMSFVKTKPKGWGEEEADHWFISYPGHCLLEKKFKKHLCSLFKTVEKQIFFKKMQANFNESRKINNKSPDFKQTLSAKWSENSM